MPNAVITDDVVWAFTLNASSQRCHAYRNGRAVCGSPLYPMQSTAEKKFPGRHCACRKCERMVFTPTCGNRSAQGDVCTLPKRHVGRHECESLEDGATVSWQWSRHQCCHVLKSAPETKPTTAH